MNELRQHHLGIPAPQTGRPTVHKQLETAYAEAIDAGRTNEKTA